MGDGLDHISDLSLCFLKDQYFSTKKGKKKHIKKGVLRAKIMPLLKHKM